MHVWGKQVLRRAVVLLAIAVTFGLVVPATQAAEANTAISNTVPTSDLNGYQWLNYFRALGGLNGVGRNPSFEAQEASHIRYLANHTLSCESNVHDELTTRMAGCGANPYATSGGKIAANNSDITRVSASVPDRKAVSNWFVSAFHALVLLDPRLRYTGYAAYYTPSPAGAGAIPYKFTAAVDVYRGRTGGYAGSTVSFPASGAVSPLLSYTVGTESPEPFRSTSAGSSCHSWGSKHVVSAPVIVQWALASRSGQAGGSIVDVTAGNKKLPTCTLTANQYPAGSTARQFLQGTGRVTKAALYYASAPFVPGHRYQLKIGRAVVTSFTTSNLPSVPKLTATAATGAIRTSWTAAGAGTGKVSYYRLAWYSRPSCGGLVGTVTTTGRSYTIGKLVSKRVYYLQASVKNSIGAVRSTACYAVRAG